MTNRIAFFYKIILAPRKIGSFTPSSSFLTSVVLTNLPWEQIETIVELGTVTGMFTKFIAEQKIESCRVLIIEQDFNVRKTLRLNYPSFHYGAKAEKLKELLHYDAISLVDCIVSGLPFATFAEPLRDQIMTPVHPSLKPGGIFIAFQYSLQMGTTLKKFPKVLIDFVPFNIPLAFIYTCQKHDPTTSSKVVAK